MIDGAHRVGKSYIAKLFAENEYKTNIIIDFGNAPGEILDLFVNESADLNLFFAKLSAFYSTVLYPRNSLIVFDEVQQFPRARTVNQERKKSIPYHLWIKMHGSERMRIRLFG